MKTGRHKHRSHHIKYQQKLFHKIPKIIEEENEKQDYVWAELQHMIVGPTQQIEAIKFMLQEMDTYKNRSSLADELHKRFHEFVRWLNVIQPHAYAALSPITQLPFSCNFQQVATFFTDLVCFAIKHQKPFCFPMHCPSKRSLGRIL